MRESACPTGIALSVQKRQPDAERPRLDYFTYSNMHIRFILSMRNF